MTEWNDDMFGQGLKNRRLWLIGGGAVIAILVILALASAHNSTGVTMIEPGKKSGLIHAGFDSLIQAPSMVVLCFAHLSAATRQADARG